jgi:hypothetical protein
VLQLGGRGILHQVPIGAAGHRALDEVGGIVHGQDEDGQCRMAPPDPRDGIQTIDPRHLDVRDHQVRGDVLQQRQQFLARACVRNHFHVGQQLDQSLDADAHLVVVVGEAAALAGHRHSSIQCTAPEDSVGKVK